METALAASLMHGEGALPGALLLCRTCVAVAGDDYCIVASSTRMSTGFQILKRDASMVLELCAFLPFHHSAQPSGLFIKLPQAAFTACMACLHHAFLHH